MYREYDIFYNLSLDQNLEMERIVSKIKAYSGVDVAVSKHSENLVSISHPTMTEHSITIYFFPKGSYQNGTYLIERDSIRLGTNTPEMNYIEGVALAVLKDLGGETGLTEDLPDWAREKWQGEKWWKKVGSKRSLLARLIEKLL